MATAAERRDSTIAVVERWRLDSDPRAAAGQADIDFRDMFPLEIGWGPNTTTNLERGELYPTLEIYRAMQRWIACEQGRIVACIKGAPPPEGVLRPGELTTAGAAAAANGTPPPPKAGVVLPADVTTPTPTPTLIPVAPPRRVPWWLWPAAVGAGVLVFMLARGRRRVA